MALELHSSRSPTLAAREAAHMPVRSGAELVHLAEEFYVRVFAVGCAILLAGSALALSLATLERGAPRLTTALFVTGATALSLVGLARPANVYRRLRAHSALQLTPAAFGALAVLLDGPTSECWWIALPLLWIVGTLSSTPLALVAATVTALAFLVATSLGGQSLISPDSPRIVPAAIGLVVYTLVGRVLIDGFVGLILGRHHLALKAAQRTLPPLRVANLATPTSSASPTPAAPSTTRSRPRPASRLTARQLEVTLLLRDGLRQTEIAACLAISVRQVERLLAAARQRVGATTTSQLVAMLTSGALAPPPDQPNEIDLKQAS